MQVEHKDNQHKLQQTHWLRLRFYLTDEF